VEAGEALDHLADRRGAVDGAARRRFGCRGLGAGLGRLSGHGRIPTLLTASASMEQRSPSVSVVLRTASRPQVPRLQVSDVPSHLGL